MKRSTGRFGVAAGLIAAALAFPGGVEGQFGPRAGSWQFSIPINFVFGEQISGEGESYADISDDVGWGFGFGYHFSNRFMLGAEMNWLSAHYDAAVEVDDDGNGTPDDLQTVGGSLEAASLLAVAQFNLIESGRFTPFVQGKIGTTFTDSNIPSGPVDGICWWDPWWGYVCDAWQPTYSTWSFAYGGSLGLRFQLAPTFFLEGSYNFQWVDFDSGNPSFDGIRLNIGFSY